MTCKDRATRRETRGGKSSSASTTFRSFEEQGTIDLNILSMA
jgi:hypothetical protein